MIDQNELSKALEFLKSGGVVAIPTETVYGLAADASNPLAIQKIFDIKGRPANHPLIVHVGQPSLINQWATDIPNGAYTLARTFWPGPLTLILKKAAHVSALVTGGQDSIGLRVPNHPMTLALLNALGGGVAAPSANKFGRISPTTAIAVAEELGVQVDMILDGGPCALGLESTIVDFTGEVPVILRPGMISQREIEEVLHRSVETKQQSQTRVSGSCKSHYAPVKPTRYLTQDEMVSIATQNLNETFTAIAFSTIPIANVDTVLASHAAADYAATLYQTLRNLDKTAASAIWIEQVPNEPEWDAVRDRLLRASA